MRDSIILVEPHLLSLINPNLQWLLYSTRKCSQTCSKFLSVITAEFSPEGGENTCSEIGPSGHYHPPGSDV